MRKGDYLFVGHMFSDGITVLDVADPRAPKPVTFFTGGPNTRSHHIQVAGDLMLAVNGANILALQTYDQAKSYYENSLADNFSSGKGFAAGLRIYDVSKPAGAARDRVPLHPRHRAQPALVCRRPLRLHFRPFRRVHRPYPRHRRHAGADEARDRRPFWLPGMNRAAGETPSWPKGKRVALHHMITAGNLGYAAWRDGGFTILDIGDVDEAASAVAHQFHSALSGRHAHAAAASRARPRARARREQRRALRQGHQLYLGGGCARGGESGADRDAADAARTRISARSAISGRTTCTRTGPARSRARRWCSRPTTMPACAPSTSATSSRRAKWRSGSRRTRRISSIRAPASRSRPRPATSMCRRTG